MNDRWWVWVPESGETEQDGRSGDGYDAQSVAENHAERLCRRDPDYYASLAEGMTMHVRSCMSGEIFVFSVVAEQSVRFRATVKEVKGSVR